MPGNEAARSNDYVAYLPPQELDGTQLQRKPVPTRHQTPPAVPLEGNSSSPISAVSNGTRPSHDQSWYEEDEHLSWPGGTHLHEVPG